MFVKMLAAVSEVARGVKPAELMLQGGRVVNLFTREIVEADLLIEGGVIAAIGLDFPPGDQVIDLAGGYIIPGLIDAHIHLESTLLLPEQFAAVVLPHGTTAVIADPHEIANVLGKTGIDFMLKAVENLPLDFYFTVPSCVPSTEMETAGGEITLEQVEKLLDHPHMLGLAEMMNFPGVIHADKMVAAKIAAARQRGKPIDGHLPAVGGRELQAYLAAGISSDHESVSAAEALEKVAYGMRVIIREGSAARNLSALIPAVQAAGSRWFMFGSDDKEAGELLTKGHLDELLRRAVARGCDPIDAIEMAALNPALHYRLDRRGAAAPGYRADLAVVDDLQNFNVRLVLKDGRVVAREGALKVELPSHTPEKELFQTVRLLREISGDDFIFKAPSDAAPVIGIIPGQIITEKLMLEPKRDQNGAVLADPQRDIVKIAVVERHRRSGRIALGLLQGLGLRQGAIASSVAHDSHNIIVAGVSETAMAAAVNALARSGGGFAVVDGAARLSALLPLPVAGLISPEPATRVAAGLKQVTAAAQALGAAPLQPFLTLSFLALPVIPHLKITDRGLFDVDRFSFV